MNTTVLNSIRTSQGFSRSVAYLIIVAIVGVVLERIIYYSLEKTEIIERENVVEKINRVAPHKARQLGLPQTPTQAQIERSKSNDTKLSEAVISVQDTLDVLAYELLNDGDPEKAQDKLDRLYSSLLDYDKQAIRDFAETEAHIEKHQLADIIKQRHEDMVLNYRTEMDALLANMRAIQATDGTDDKLDVVLTAIKQLESKQLKRSQQPFDPNNLPNRSLQPNEDNKPKLTPEQFAQAGLFSNPYPKYAALGDFTYDKLPGATNPAYLGESVEIKLTQAIRDQAAALNHDPVQIYNWVRNNIVWIPSWGAMQEADITLGSKRGNALDIASLHIALLRASQIPARYVHGTIEVPADKFMNWAGGFSNIEAAARYASSGGIPMTGMLNGGKITHIRMEHIWVEAAADFHPSRAAVNIDADSWVEMDASFKQYEFLEGLDIAAITGIDGQTLANEFIGSGSINEQEGWISGFDPIILQNAQTQMQIALEDYITTNLPDATVGDVIGGAKTIIHAAPGLPSSLPNSIVVTGTRYAELPIGLQPRIHVSLGRDILGQPIGGITLPWAQVNNHKFTLSYRPATTTDEDTLLSFYPADLPDISTTVPGYLVNVIPELKLNGALISTGQSTTLGSEIQLSFTLHHPSYNDRNFYSLTYAGSYQVIASIGGSISMSLLGEVQSKMSQSISMLDSLDPASIASVTREDTLGDLFFSGSLGYFSQYDSFSRNMGIQNGMHQGLMPSIGTYGYVPKVNYLFGLPRSIEAGEVQFDLDSITTFSGIEDGDNVSQVNYLKQTGIMSSALENAVPEQMFSDDPINPAQAVSTVKIFTLANLEGQKFYQITKSNLVSAIQNLNHDSSTINEIQQAIQAGKEVITHTDMVSLSGWRGVGYIIQDPITGDGAYKISGGINGGSLAGIVDKFYGLVTDDHSRLPNGYIKAFTKSLSKGISFMNNVRALMDSGCGFIEAMVISGGVSWISTILGKMFKAFIGLVATTIIGVVIAIVLAILIQFIISQITLLIIKGAALNCQNRSK